MGKGGNRMNGIEKITGQFFAVFLLVIFVLPPPPPARGGVIP